MTRSRFVLAPLVIALGCSSGSTSLSGSLSQVYDLSYNSVVIVLEDSSVQIKYVSANGDAAILTVDTANIADVAGTTIDLTQLVNGQPRGVIENVGITTTEFPIEIGIVTFNQVPKVGQTLSGDFATTLAMPMGETLNGTFSATVNAP